ncbi:MAG: hypothetical protein K2F90_06540 [Clostridiales bacterium]|nr:hypothetical protein [Clostridiales bacterium]
MSDIKINALCTVDAKKARTACDKVFACYDNAPKADGVNIVVPYTKELGDGIGEIYLPDMSDEDLLGSACDYILSNNARAIVRAAYDLTEAGIIEARYKLSPIMLLHKLGILGQCTVAGGVCLDNDDLDLMAQEGVPLILLPTADAGYGHGYAPVCAAVHRGIRIGVGTFDGKYNATADLDYEIKFLTLTANAEMRTENALDSSTLKKILAFE